MSTESGHRSTGLAAATARRRRLEEQVAALEGFEQRLSQRVHAARVTPGRSETVRELLSRLGAVRARRQEAQFARTEATQAEQRLRDDAREEQEQLDRARRAAREREEFHLACLNAPFLRRTDSTDGALISS